MFEISKRIELDAGHRVPAHQAGCRFLHGHRYVVTAFAGIDQLPEAGVDPGMVVDFSVLKQVLMTKIHAVYDHRLLLWDQDPLVVAGGFQDSLAAYGLMAGVVLVPCVPTAEGLAQLWGGEVRDAVEEMRRARGNQLFFTRLEVQETPSSVAVWYADGS